jgi:hypothetical protein
MNSEYAPILVATLNRYQHFKRCIESLANCPEAKSSDLYIALDYPPSEKYCEGYNEIVAFLESGIVGFKSVNVLKRKRNLGGRRNFAEARREIFREYDRVIISEDDNEFSRDFLNFINSGLELYKDRKDIFTICGYIYPLRLDTTGKDAFLHPIFSGWGFGIWREKFKDIKFDVDEAGRSLKNSKIRKKIKHRFLIKALEQIVKTGNITGDTLICLHQYKNNLYSVYPTNSRVRNHGHDGTGVNCVTDTHNSIYSNQEIVTNYKDVLNNKNLEVDPKMIRSIDRYFKYRSFNFYINNPAALIKRILNQRIDS